MAFWLLKSEPSTWSWEDQVKAGIASWDGVRNHQAAGNMKRMSLGDRAFFYHSGTGREISPALKYSMAEGFLGKDDRDPTVYSGIHEEIEGGINDKITRQAKFQGRAIVGIVEVVKTYYPDPTDPKGIFGMVDVKTVSNLKTPVTLAQIKATSALAHLALVRQSRLSVMPIDTEAWHLIQKLGGG